MANEAHTKVKPLEIGREMLSWFCTDAIDEPLSKDQMLATQIFRLFYAVVCTVLIIIFNAFQFQNFTLTMSGIHGDINGLFFGLFQSNATLEALSCVCAIFISGPKLASLFRSIDNIYNTSENLLFEQPIGCIVLSDFSLSIQMPDPDERLVKTNERCENFYGNFIKFLTNWSVKTFAFIGLVSILICQLKYGLGEINAESFYHPMRTV